MEKTFHFQPISFRSVDFGKGHIAQSTYRRHWKREFFDIGGKPVERVAETEMVHGGYDFEPGHQKNGDQPVAVEKSSRCEGLRTGLRGNPTGNQVSQAKHLRRVGLHEILVPQQAGKWRCKRSSRHVIQDENLLLPEADKSPLGNFGKKDDRHPTGCRPNSGSDHQAQIHRARHHQKADEESLR